MQIMRFDTSMESLITVGRSESFADLNNPEYGVSRSFMASQVHRDLFSQCEYFFYWNLLSENLAGRWYWSPNFWSRPL